MEFTIEIYNKYRYMVYKIAWKYASPYIAFEDLVQEGYKGLEKACRKYKKGFEFSTYAWNKIHGEIRSYIAYKKDIIHIPVGKKSSVKHLYEELPEDIEYETKPMCLSEDLKDALLMLEESVAELIRMKYIDDISMTEMVKLTGLTYDSIVYRIEKGLIEMRKYL
jgi:RNA polymerase sigma factor (sigma-70 family)